jgi:hypothetical protein
MDELDKPAFGVQAAKTEDSSESATTEVSQTESGEVKEQPTSGGEPSNEEPVVEENRVPYSRFKTAIDRARAAERALEEIESQRSERPYEPPTQDSGEVKPYSGALPPYWAKMYGDNPTSREAYSYELVRQNAIREEARREALEAVREERSSESKVLLANERTIDERLEDLSYSLGRELSEQEQSALLDIVDEYTPKDADGNYAGELIPMDKAYEILSMKTSQVQTSQSRNRREATNATSSRSQGETNTTDKNNQNWNPLDWNSYKRRIPN